jgi:hypothetical protein
MNESHENLKKNLRIIFSLPYVIIVCNDVNVRDDRNVKWNKLPSSTRSKFICSQSMPCSLCTSRHRHKYALLNSYVLSKFIFLCLVTSFSSLTSAPGALVSMTHIKKTYIFFPLNYPFTSTIIYAYLPIN